VNLCIFAIPAISLYFLGVTAAFVAARYRRRREAELAAADGAE